MKVKKVLHFVNIPYHIANHVVGKHHTATHRRISGVIVIMIGVSVMHIAQHIGNIFISLLAHLISSLIDGTGLIPFVHEVEKTGEQIEQKQNCTTC